MKNNLLFVLLGVALTLCVAASTTDLMTVKPAVPKEILMEEFNGDDSYNNSKRFITNKTREGFIVKSFTYVHYTNYYSAIVIMEKY